MAIRSSLLLALALFWPCLAISPTEKVIKMLESLEAEVTTEGEDEESNFAEFSTFCANTTEKKETAIKEGVDGSDVANATILSKTAQYNSALATINDAKAKATEFDKQKTDSERQCQDAKKAYLSNEADLSSAVVGLQSAIEKMEAAKGTGALLQFGSSMEHSLQLASAMGLLEESKRQSVTAFLQGHRDKPWLEEEGAEYNKKQYEYQSGGIVTTLQDLLAEFTKERTEADSNWNATQTSCSDTASTLADKIATNDDALTNQEQTASNLKQDIGSTKQELLLLQKTLKADRTYLSELKENCAARAADNAQRKSTREGEIEAIGAALKVLKTELPGSDPTEEPAPASFLQLNAKEVSVNHVVQAGQTSAQATLMKNLQLKASAAVEAAGKTLGSSRLTGLALRMRKTAPDNVAASPLQAVKDMVQKLVNDLIKEAEQESSQKGFCDAEIGKAKMERDRRMREAKKLSAKIKVLDTKRTELIESNEVLTSSLASLESDLSEATEIRTNQSKSNLATIADSKAGAEAVKGAIKALSDFYAKASRSSARHDKEMALLQLKSARVAASVDPAEGGYAGKQQQSNGIVTMMEVIQGDFEKSASSTAAAEEKAAEEFTKLRLDSKTEIAGTSTQLKLNKEEKESSENSLRSMESELGRTMDLLDASLRTLEDLKPQCIDNRMSYEERKAKRDAEIQSLTSAMCTLDPDGVQPECQK